MSSSFQFSIDRGFKVIDALQQQIVQNAAGLLKPGYNRRNLKIGFSSGNESDMGFDPTQQNGGKGATIGGGDTLALQGSSIHFEQGTIDPAFDPAQLAIRGEGFFLLAENALPNARVFLTRAGDFHFDPQGRLVNNNGMFVIGAGGKVAIDANGRLTGPPPFILRQGDGTVPLPEVTLGRVGSPSQLAIANYGDTIYRLTPGAGPLGVFPNGKQPEVGFVQASSIEVPNRYGIAAVIASETTTAVQTYKIFKDMLTEFNKSVDDSINLVK